MTSRAALFVCVLLSACSGSAASPSPHPAGPGTPEAHVAAATPHEVTSQVVTALFLHATMRRPSPADLALWTSRLDTQGGLEQLIDTLLDAPRFLEMVAPKLVADRMTTVPTRYLFPLAWLLKTMKGPGGESIYYIKKPCAPDAVDVVKPWWEPTTRVKVCKDAHRPERFFNPNTKIYCDSVKSAPSEELDDFCGCGPNLMRCFPTAALRDTFNDSLIHEVSDTIADLTRQNRPLADVFTTNATLRDRNSETIYRRWKTEALRLPELAGVDDLPSWPEKGKWAPRDMLGPDEHAGILTMPNTIFESSGLRPVMKNVFTILWCSQPDSTSVKTDEFLKVGGANLRAGEGWQRLVALPVCTSCHARLDYSMQFFQGYLDVRVGEHYEAAGQRTGSMNFYSRNIDDFRGKDVPTPMGFARLSMSQPEFGECFAHKINRHIYGPNIEPDDEAALLEGFDPQRTTFRGLMRTALLRYARKRLSGAPPMASDVGAQAANAVIAPSADPELPLSHPAIEIISDSCMDCHDGPDAESGLDLREYLSKQMIPPETFAKILDRVTARQMPPMGSTLEPRKRGELLTELVSSEFRNDPAKRARALRHVVGQDRASGPYPFEAAITAIEDAVGVQLGRTSRKRTNTGLAASAKRFLEGDVSPEYLQFSPDFSAATGLLALDACKAAGLRDAALDECLARATDPALYIRPTPYHSSMSRAP